MFFALIIVGMAFDLCAIIALLALILRRKPGRSFPGVGFICYALVFAGSLSDSFESGALFSPFIMLVAGLGILHIGLHAGLHMLRRERSLRKN